jgi:tetratricopeptide (TPR) repeat protein
MEPDLYHQAQTKFQHSDFEAALALCNKALQDTNLTTAFSKQIKQLEADCLLELKQARLAADLYEELQCYSQAGFAAVLSQDLDHARMLYKQAPHSSPSKWGNFLIEFLHQASNRQYSFTQDIPTPGYLTFRLYFEATYSYFLHYQLNDYLQRFLDYRNQLINVYPEIIKDMGSAHLARQEYQQALEHLAEAENKCFEDAGIHFKSAMAHLALNHNNQARESLLIVRKMLPGSELVERLLQGL